MKKITTTITTVKDWYTQPFTFLLLISIGAWFVAYTSGLTMIYNDAMSHINISRLVMDNQEPGLTQLGSVWLPLNHILPLIFVWNDWAWRTGLAASIFSMLSFVISGLAIFKTVLILTKNQLAATVAALAFATNLNMLYLQSTPLTEPLFIGFFSLSVLVFTLWLTKKDNAKYLLTLGILGFFQVITRYDGWFVVIILALMIIYHELIISKKTFSETLGKLFLFGLPVGFGIGLWLLWNAAIFGDPLFFVFGPYSAHAQQVVIQENAGLLTKGSLVHSTMAYAYAAAHNVGTWLLSFSAIGLVYLLFQRHKLNQSKRILLSILLATPILFNVIALFFGFSILNVPELNWNPSGNSSGQWFNVRYGTLALPMAAILFGIFASWRKLAVILAIEILVIQAFITYTSGVITIIDGTKGSSSFQNYAVANKLQDFVEPEDTVLMSMSFFNPVAFRSDVELNQIIHEGVSKKWPQALKNPHKYADWIVMGSDANNGDPVKQALIDTHQNSFLTHYQKIYSNNQATIYKRISEENISLNQKE